MTSAGLAHIFRLEGLQALSLDLPNDSPEGSVDDAVAGIGAMKNLQELTLWGTISDKTLKSVAGLKKLHRLDLLHARGYTEDQLAKTVDALPELQTVVCGVGYKKTHSKTQANA